MFPELVFLDIDGFTDCMCMMEKRGGGLLPRLTSVFPGTPDKLMSSHTDFCAGCT